MAVPSKRRTSRSKKERASHFALKTTATTKCECGTVILPHRACANCGNYRKRQAVNVEKRLTRKKRADKAKK